jgi:hypothetical protein
MGKPLRGSVIAIPNDGSNELQVPDGGFPLEAPVSTGVERARLRKAAPSQTSAAIASRVAAVSASRRSMP